MRESNRHLWVIGGAVAVSASVAIISASVYEKGWVSQETAAWVQAIGSILAVAAVGVVAVWQGAEARKLVNTERQAYRQAIAELADEVAETVEDLADLIVNEPEFMAYEGISTLAFIRVGAALQDFDATRLVSAKAILAMRDLARTIERAGEVEAGTVDCWRRNGALDEDTIASVEAWRDTFRRARQVLWDAARE